MSLIAPILTLAAAGGLILGSKHQHFIVSQIGRLASRKLSRLLCVVAVACWAALFDQASEVGSALTLLALGLVTMPALAVVVSPPSPSSQRRPAH